MSRSITLNQLQVEGYLSGHMIAQVLQISIAVVDAYVRDRALTAESAQRSIDAKQAADFQIALASNR